jgi:hypothetical protein
MFNELGASDREHQHHIVRGKALEFFIECPFINLKELIFNFGGINWHPN